MKKPRDKKSKKKKRRSISLPPQRKLKRRHVWLKVLPEDLWLKVRRGKTIYEALQKTDVELEGDCGGLGKCGKCKVKVLSSLGPPSMEGKELLGEDEIRQGMRLACRTKLKKDLTIQVGESEEEVTYYQILKVGRRPIFYLDPPLDKKLVTLDAEGENRGLADFERIKLALGPEYQDLTAPLHCLRTLPEMLTKTNYRGAAVVHDKTMIAWQPWEQGGRRYGLVFDLGTSTLVGKLISLLDGKEIAAISRLNSQSKFGANVISRLQYAKENRQGLRSLNELIVRDLNLIARRLLEVAGLSPEDIFIGVAAGNTTMQHLLLSLDPSGIAQAPFNPVSTDGMILKAAEVGLVFHPEALLYVMPTRSGYIGGDLISAVIASGAAEQDDLMILGMDLGTNGEIFLGNRRRLLTCSAAAGPALEGAKISHGMIAKDGAIEGVTSGEEDLWYRVISNIKPKGICGSGLVDLVAVLLHCGIVDYEGLLQPVSQNLGDNLMSRVVKRSGAYDFLVASPEESFDGRPIYLTQKDVRELQLAKGAVAAGIKTLMDEMGVRVEDIDRVYLAGALGNYVHPLSAERIGLIPSVRPGVIQSLGNAASTGASMVLLSKGYWQMANELAHSIEHIELSTRIDFNDYFIESLNFPENNIW
ncbi:MAG: ASKHA domain-containing protein [Deltaproteobacteria bacterium]|nr:ASKHA domain-containing protein [Deltaproteobacteria bacterium]